LLKSSRPASECSMCGNNIVEKREECDNSKSEGCKNCKVQNGFKCRGMIDSFCNRADPVCSDGVIEVPERVVTTGATKMEMAIVPVV
jgi:hypothetical protein